MSRNPNRSVRVHSTDDNYNNNRENSNTQNRAQNNAGSVPPTKKIDLKKDFFGDSNRKDGGFKKPKNKLEGMQSIYTSQECNLMAQNASSIFDYIYTKYYEQLIPILMSDEVSIYYDVIFDVLDFFYYYPFMGQKFHELPQQFLHFLEEALIECQEQIVQKDGEMFRKPPNSMQ